jgi:hypothetical protein
MIADRSNPVLAPLSPTVEALLSHERVLPGRPALVRARLLARARASLQKDNVIPLATRRPTSRVRRVVYATAAGLAAAASVAAAYQLLMERPTPPRVEAPPPARRSPMPRSPESVPELTPAPASTTTPAASNPSEATAASQHAVASERLNPVRNDDKVVEELRLLDSARQASARGDYTSVLALTAEHERSYPNGRLTEEREVLRVKALVGLGRSAEARRAAARFSRQFPRSVLLRTVEDMVSSGR